MNPFSLSDRTALITGSSGSIGRALASGLQAAGADVVWHGHEPSPPAKLPAGAVYLQADLTRPAAPARLIARAFAQKPALNVLVCNAGGFFDTPFMEMTPERWARTIDLNVRAAYFLAQAFAQKLAAARRPGAILLTASTNGFQPEEDCTAYDTSKGAVVMLTRSLALNLAPLGIRVNGLAPGLILTPLNAASLAASPARRRLYEKKILLGRLGEPADCAGAAVFLLSAAARYITGQIITIDGGLTVGQIGRL